ncbi:MAG: 3-deoxy-8-phosphooctulonate synthase [Parachlamydiaceae bacterium]|nr:3-deoxy-8-phosphooctulonate synthase [Parachlamydiaceae bacterium]
MQNQQRRVPVKNFFIGGGAPLAVMSGPCVIEDEEHALRAAESLKAIFEEVQIPFIYKSSYDKANRSSLHGFRGPGLDEGLRILERIKREFDLPIVTDVHSPEEAISAGQVCDILQIPAFLCRQTDIIVAAASTKAVVSVKKGQFMAPWDMENVVHKVQQSGNQHVILTDRGVTFGYNNLVSDMRAIPIMQRFGVPVCFDATHSVQLPGGQGTSSGGQREFIEILAKAAIAAGADCLFMESHPNPSLAKSDRDSVISFEALPALLRKLKRLYEVIHE